MCDLPSGGDHLSLHSVEVQSSPPLIQMSVIISVVRSHLVVLAHPLLSVCLSLPLSPSFSFCHSPMEDVMKMAV